MAAHPEDIVIRDGVLISVSDAYIKKNNGYFEIPDSVTAIGVDAVYACTNLKKIAIPGSVTTICFGAFEYCSSLEEVTISDSVATIGDCAFANCYIDLEITITSDQSGEKAQELKAKLQKDYPYFTIHIESSLDYSKKCASFFFSPPNEQEDGAPSPNNQNQPKPTKTNQELNHGSTPRKFYN